MTQKKHGSGSNARYFWAVTTASGTGVYRSRHATAAGVRGEFARNGNKITKIKPYCS